jgi:hypothetical protein
MGAVSGSGSEVVDLETLDVQTPPPASKHQPRSRPVLGGSSPRSRWIVLALVVAFACGSAATIAVGHLRQSRRPTVSVPISRVGQSTPFDGWTMTVTSDQRAAEFEQAKASPGQIWIVARLSIQNHGTSAREFDTHLVVLRYFSQGVYADVPSAINAATLVPPRTVVPLDLGFSIPASTQDYSVVVRRDLESELVSGDAIEIDLNAG